MSLSVRTRFEVFKRDRFTCSYCGRTPPNVLLEVDHIVPLAAGGSDDITNLTTACWDCNHGKAARLLEEGTTPVTQRVVDDAEERVAQATAYAEAVRGEQQLQAQFEDMVYDAWAIAYGATRTETAEGVGWRFELYGRFPAATSVRRLLRRLPVEDMLEAVDITASRKRSPNHDAELYFFGICWNKVRALEEGR